MKDRPLIVLTNDDGIKAPGIEALWRALHAADFADLAIIAPATERSGAGVAITWDRPLLIREVKWPGDTPAWSIDGMPADCVKMAERIILKEKPDFVVSGINAGSNAGRNVLHSGTIGAVIEGVLRGIPGIAISCEDGDDPNYHVAEKYVAPITEYLLENPLTEGCFLNINIPRVIKEQVKGFRMTCQGRGRWSENPYLHLETEHGPSYWLGGKPEELVEDETSDIALLREGYITATPIHIHELTDQNELALRKENFEQTLENKCLV